ARGRSGAGCGTPHHRISGIPSLLSISVMEGYPFARARGQQGGGGFRPAIRDSSGAWIYGPRRGEFQASARRIVLRFWGVAAKIGLIVRRSKVFPDFEIRLLIRIMKCAGDRHHDRSGPPSASGYLDG